MKEIIYIKKEEIEKFRKGYNFLINKLENNWRINDLDKLLIEIAEEYIESLDYMTERKGELKEWEFYD